MIVVATIGDPESHSVSGGIRGLDVLLAIGEEYLTQRVVRQGV